MPRESINVTSATVAGISIAVGDEIVRNQTHYKIVYIDYIYDIVVILNIENSNIDELSFIAIGEYFKRVVK